MKIGKKELLKKYFELARKLGKLPTLRETERLICSSRQVLNNFDSFRKFKEAALDEYPVLNELAAPVVTTDADVESYRLGLEKKRNKKENSEFVQTVSTLDYIAKFADSVFRGTIKATPPKKKGPLTRTHTLMLSDLHIGADIDGRETGTGLSFGKVEESRRLAAVIKQAIDYKPQYRNQSKLVVALIGDVIENSMHDPRTGDVISMQVCRAISLLSQAIGKLATVYPEVTVECATGNHDRITSRHHGRAVHGKYDSYSTIIYYALKAALINVKNVKVNIPLNPLASYDVYGMKIGYTHGDTVIKAGGIYSTVSVKSLEAQVDKINSGLPEGEKYKALLYGHTHIGHIIHLSNGCVLVGNGALPPPDPFAVSIGSFQTNNGQWIFESVPGIAVGDVRYIRCGGDYDKDESLDKIIKPFEGV